jgi:hypothetical protein
MPSSSIWRDECSETKDQLEQLSMMKECIVVFSCSPVVLRGYHTRSHSSSLFT